MNVLDLFSGIGGFSLGLERAGMQTVAFCEIDPFCQRVLQKHWPTVPIYDDVRTLTVEQLQANEITVDVITGGFPCQDLSVAGRNQGLKGKRSGLWSEFARLIGEIRPRYAIVENVSVLLSRGLERVLGDLAALGFDAEWHCIPASAVGAPHRRDRIWIIAYMADATRQLLDGSRTTGQTGRPQPANSCTMAHTDSTRLSQRQEHQLLVQRPPAVGNGWWDIEPNVGRVAHGVPNRVDRLRSLGNAVVPQIPEIIGRAIMKVEGLITSSV